MLIKSCVHYLFSPILTLNKYSILTRVQHSSVPDLCNTCDTQSPLLLLQTADIMYRLAGWSSKSNNGKLHQLMLFSIGSHVFSLAYLEPVSWCQHLLSFQSSFYLPRSVCGLCFSLQCIQNNVSMKCRVEHIQLVSLFSLGRQRKIL